jgi:hypothetical protein
LLALAIMLMAENAQAQALPANTLSLSSPAGVAPCRISQFTSPRL